MFNAFNPSIELGSLSIQWYALFILTGVCLAIWLGVQEGKKIGIKKDDIYLGILIILPIAIIGTRLWYVLFNWSDFFGEDGSGLSGVLGFEDGEFVGLSGLAIQGGIISAGIATILYCKKKNISIYRALDIVAPGFLIGQICGRFGNYMNQELYGPIVDHPFILQHLGVFGDQMYIDGAYRHPVFFYEAFLNGILFVLILVFRHKKLKTKSKWTTFLSGDLVGFYLVWYGMVRTFTETLRAHSGVSEPLMLGPIYVSILISVLFIITGIAYLILKRLFGRQTPYYDILKEIEDNKVDTILLDLDGTILDSKKLIIESFIYTFNHFRPEKEFTKEELDSFFGPTLKTTFSKFAKDDKECEEMIKYYREYNLSNYDGRVKLFPGVKDTIKYLYKKGYKIGIVSSKAHDLVLHTLEITGISQYVDVVLGQGSYENPKPAPDGILKAMEKLGTTKALYVGDTKDDILAANNAKVKACAVLYTDHPEQMIDLDIDYAINKFVELISVLGE
ncbi:MAG: prolipoprotein diacylglyceryl transferase [Acholeplasmatales bacterium]|nr:prolipoprotein diacylglyceryl transferase [Acholeplasmatales bacterium]